MPIVSVVTPVYNGARYLPAAIDSLLAQTLTDWELIVIDDGSTDETPQILRRYHDLRIRTAWQPNAGEASARNHGLNLARGELVAFLDADDLYLPNALADMAEFLVRHEQHDVVLSDGYVCDDAGTILTRLADHRPRGISSGCILEPLVLQSTVVTVPVCTMTRRACIERHSARFDTALGFGTDWDFWIRLSRTSSFGFLNALTCKYRVHLSNMTRLLGQRRWRDDLAAGRLKLLNSSWFGDLSLATRRQFYQDLLITFLSQNADGQRGVLEHRACRALPDHDQADLWRRVAIDNIVHGDTTGFADFCLRRAVALRRTDRKSLLVRRLLSIPGGRLIAPALLHAWSRLHATLVQARQWNRPSAKAVPIALQPVGD